MQNDKLLRILDETRNITHAADRLYITQPALSRRIKSIGHVLGAELLLRSRQGIRFTPAGEAALRLCRRRTLCTADLYHVPAGGPSSAPGGRSVKKSHP